MDDSGTATTAEWPFPATLRISDRLFVGRDAEMAELRDAWARAVSGGTELVLIGGEAGAGKTRLAVEAARELHGVGAIVLSGLNDSELSLPYQPWVMVIDQLLRELPAAVVRARSDELAALRVLDPRIDRHLTGPVRSAPVDPEVQRHLLLRALAELLTSATDIAPTVLVLDDLHWAGQQTLDVLRYLVRLAPVGRLLVVGTFRDTGDAAGDPLSATLADLRRLEQATRLKLTGLDLGSVLELVAASRGGAPSDIEEIGAAIAQRTGGNPFLVCELCLHLDASTDAPVPDSVIEVVGARTQRLSPDARRTAEVIAVAANRVQLTVVGDATGLDGDELAAAIGELVDSGLVDEVAGPVLEHQYAHALLRDAVVASLAGPAQMRLHLALAEAIERAHETDRRSVLPDLVRHYAASSAVGGRDKAIYYGRRAAAQARQTAAYDQGISVLRTVLHAVPGTGRDQVDLAIDLVDLLQRSGHHLESLAVGRDAFDAALAMGDVGRQAEVALQCERVNHLAGGGGPEVAEMLGAVLAQIGDGDQRTSVRLRSALGRARCLAGDDAAGLIESALSDARELGDEEALALAIEVSFLGSQPPEVHLSRTYELERLTTSLRDPWAGMWATANRVRVLLVMGRLAEAAEELRGYRDVAYRHRLFLCQFMSCVLQAVLHLAGGRFEDAESAAEEAEAIGLGDEGLSRTGVYGLLMFSIRREQGRLEEMRPVLSLLAETGQRAGVWTPGAALAAAELGLLDEARASFDAVAPGRFSQIPRDHVWPAALTFLAEAALLLDEREGAAVLLDELAPYGGQTLMVGFTTSFGPTDRLRSALSELVGQRSDADRLIGAARDLAVQAGSPVWQARVEHTQSWILARRGDAAGAATHHRAARALGDPLGMRSVVAAPAVAVGVAPPPPDATAPPGGLSPREGDVLGLIAEGCTNREIAARLRISPNTAANHVRAILQKTACANRAEAAAYCVRLGLAP